MTARIGVLIVLLACAAPAGAQLPSPSAAALGLGDNFTADARGFASAAWNPAGLGMPDNPPSSFALMAIRAVTGLDPVTPGDLADFQGEPLPDAVRAEWLARIQAEGSQSGTAAAEVSFLAASAGPVAVHLSASAHLLSDVGPEAAELLLYGNAGRTGEAGDFTLDHAALDLAVTSTVALAYGRPVLRGPTSTLSVGGTVKYTSGHVLVTGRDQGSELTADPLELRLRFPIAQTDTSFSMDELGNGSGLGLDLAVAWSDTRHSAAVVVRNVFNTFEWDEEHLYHRRGEAIFTRDDSGSDFAARPFSTAPEALREHVAGFRFRPEVAVGGSYRVRHDLVVSADARHRTSGAEVYGPATHLGVGAELTPAPWLAARAGAAGLTGGYLLSAGVGLRFGVVELSGSLATRRTDLGGGRVGMLTFSSAAR